MYYIVITKKQQNVCYNFFESFYSFANFKCKDYILYSKLLLQWAVRKKKNFPSAELKKIISRNFEVSHWKKKRVDYFRSKKAKQNISSKTNFDCKSPMKWPIYIVQKLGKKMLRRVYSVYDAGGLNWIKSKWIF